jgi:hypothetical protein
MPSSARWPKHHELVGRSTNGVDLLLDSESDLHKIHGRLLGRGYSRKSPGSRHIREDATRVQFEFRIAGEYPGDGQPKPVALPSPSAVSQRDESGLPFIDLCTLIELKLASAKSAPQRIKDRADVLEIIHVHGLTSDFAGQLDPYVRSEFRELVALPPPDGTD